MKTMLILTAFALITGWSSIALAEGSSTAAPTPAPAANQENPAAATTDKEIKNEGNDMHNCYSKHGCTGVVRSHRDRHNCRNHDGKSWRDGRTGTCYSPA